MNALGVIFARGASKRLPRKNVKPLGGLPLVGWSCRAAVASQIDRVVLSTEDSEIARIGKENGADVPFIRPDELAADFADDIDIALHALEKAEAHYSEHFDVFVLIQATTPFVRPEHFNACLDRLSAGDVNCVFTARHAEDHPRWTWALGADGRVTPYIDTPLKAEEQHGQNLTPAMYPTGAAWAINTSALKEQKAVYSAPLAITEMSWETAVDIDDERDWAIAEAVMSNYGITPVANSF